MTEWVNAVTEWTGHVTHVLQIYRVWLFALTAAEAYSVVVLTYLLATRGRKNRDP